jgi:hypothetical protein
MPLLGPLAVGPSLWHLLPNVLAGGGFFRTALARAYQDAYGVSQVVHWGEDDRGDLEGGVASSSDADSEVGLESQSDGRFARPGGTVAVIVDCDRLLEGVDYFWALGRSIVQRYPTIGHLLVSVDDVGRDLKKLGVLLEGIRTPLTSLLIQYHDADTFAGDLTSVLQLPVKRRRQPLTAGWACVDDLPTLHDFGKIAQMPS